MRLTFAIVFVIGTITLLISKPIINDILDPNAPSDKKRVKVFILSGQSNMQGHGKIYTDPNSHGFGGKGTLEHLVRTKQHFKTLVDEISSDVKWKVRKDVFISYYDEDKRDRFGPLTVGYGYDSNNIGPELGFGWVLGNYYEEPVYLIKCAWGGKSLAIDFRPPSSGQFTKEWGKGDGLHREQITKDPNSLGRYFHEIISCAKRGIDKLPAVIQGYTTYDLVGFGWHQGWNDRCTAIFADEYEYNLANFIRDIRKSLKAPTLPFVIADTGMGGPREDDPNALKVKKAQRDVASYNEFAGNVLCVGTSEYYRPEKVSPTGQIYHWNGNAETYSLIGNSMGVAMKTLLKRGKGPEGNETVML